MTITLRILGCGSSGGVPRLGGHWGDCDPSNPKNIRKRCSLLVTRTTSSGVTRVLIDTSPDLRQQLLDSDVGELDAVIYTHAHADHVHGLDDIRMIVYNMRQRLQVWADGDTGKGRQRKGKKKRKGKKGAGEGKASSGGAPSPARENSPKPQRSVVLSPSPKRPGTDSKTKLTRAQRRTRGKARLQEVVGD
ncbi:MAG: MBL fold metallo-hydrolase, partial [Octadecabacter sp.]